jgi:uncharacterized membrane protein
MSNLTTEPPLWVYFLTLAILMGTILAIFGMRYFSAAVAARARLANDEAYRALAEKAAAGQAENQASLGAIRAELASVSASLAVVEKVLKQVG